MRSSPLILVVAVALATGHAACAQAGVETVQLTRQAVQSTGNANKKPQIKGKGAPSPAPAPAEEEPRDVKPYDALNRIPPDCGCAKDPFFSVTSSEVAPGTQITLASPNPDAEIYYTTDGWTPTSASQRYTGPIVINDNTHLQAVALEPQKLPSLVIDAMYTVNPASNALPQDALAAKGVLAKGTVLRFVIGLSASSESAHVGDHVPLLLDQSVMDGKKSVIPNGSPGDAVVTQVERAGPGGKPGVLVLQVLSLDGRGVSIPLTATLTLAAPDKAAKSRRVSNPAMVHVAGATSRGDEADIQAGMTLSAMVAADTPVHP